MTDPVPLLNIEHLTVAYRQGKRWLDAVRDVSLRIERGQAYGLVGESGSGKSTLALTIMGYLAENAAIRQGSIELAGRNLLMLSAAELRQVWRDLVRLVPQNPLSALNPSLRIGEQIVETLPASLRWRAAQARVLELLGMVRLADPERVARSYPHQLSGGMQQRVMIAMALSGSPALLVLDEPTTNLDVTTEAVILDLIRDLIRERLTAMLYVSHSLGVVARICDRVAVLYAGELVEDAAVADLYRRPLHPYTQGLLDSVLRIGQTKHQRTLRPIPGQLPPLDALPSGCIFVPRCPLAIERCVEVRPTLEVPVAGRQVRCHRWAEILAGMVSAHPPAPPASVAQANGTSSDVVLDVVNLEKRFAVRPTLGHLLRGQPPQTIQAVNRVDMHIRQGQTLGLVGESGSGKTTLARCIIGLTERSGGTITLLDIPLARGLTGRDRDLLRQLQMIFQHPDEALNPYLRVGDTLRRPLITLAGYSGAQADAAVARLFTRAGVVEELRQAYVRTAALKGLPRRTVIVRHLLRNALLPTITVIAISVGWLISGLIVVENVFNYPGLGRLLTFAIDRRDLLLLQAITLVGALGYALANLTADLLITHA